MRHLLLAEHLIKAESELQGVGCARQGQGDQEGHRSRPEPKGRPVEGSRRSARSKQSRPGGCPAPAQERRYPDESLCD